MAAHLAFQAIKPAIKVGALPAGQTVVAIGGFEARDLAIVVLQAIGFAPGQAAVAQTAINSTTDVALAIVDRPLAVAPVAVGPIVSAIMVLAVIGAGRRGGGHTGERGCREQGCEQDGLCMHGQISDIDRRCRR